MHKHIHPVISLMHERKRQASMPGARTDGASLALVIEGGGMRGIVSAGMTAAIEQLGFLNTIDHVYGTSAGALNGAFLLSGQATWSTTLFYDYLNNEEFLDMNRLLLGKPAVDMEYLDDVYINKRRLDFDKILQSPIDLHVVATEVTSGQSHVFNNFTTQADLRAALLATSRIPFLVGDPIRINGKDYVDAALSDPIPLLPAIDGGATHVLVLQTRPPGYAVKNNLADPIVERYLRKISPALERLYEDRPARYGELLDRVDTSSKDASLTPYIYGIRPDSEMSVLSEVEKNRNRLVHGAMAGLKSMEEALTGHDVVVEQVLRAFPADWYSLDDNHKRS